MALQGVGSAAGRPEHSTGETGFSYEETCTFV